ncbi:GDSL-type esterase/lipase family protein [Lysinibacillus fusiformis]|uniref:GDSL-type esterase/lipase family protein n=1 Tax=Lysinibacillus fusiformis TaxID=28031 RepID=UPI0037FED10B
MLKKVSIFLLMGAIALTATACVDNKKGITTPENVENKIISDDFMYDSIFKNSLFVGDSITEGFFNQELIDDTKVIADKGKITVLALETDVDDVVVKNPDHVFMNFGINDLLIRMDLNGKPVNDPIQFSIDHYSAFIQKIKKELPSAHIHILSVTPVTKEALQEYPQYKHIDAYNTKLQALAITEEVEFIDLSSIFEKRSDLHVEDGVHFKADFYKLLLEQLKTSVQ